MTRNWKLFAGKIRQRRVSPLTAGELAKAAFQNGYESYGTGYHLPVSANDQSAITPSFLYSPDDGQSQGGGLGMGSGGVAFRRLTRLAGIRDLERSI